jgi:hypothetical protein
LALQKSASIARLQEFKDLLASSSDSIEIDVVGTELALAQMYLLELDQPDSALSEYRYILENFPDDSLAPKASYGVGWVYAFKMNDRKKADEAFASLLKEYPESDYAVGAADYFVGRGAALDSLGVKTVAYYFVRAEEFLFTYERIDSAIAYYRLVCEQYPASQFRVKAITAMAFIHENITYNYEAAGSLYTFLSDSFPSTEHAQLAQVRLGLASPDIERRKPPDFADSMEFVSTDEEKGEKSDSIQVANNMNIRPTKGGIIDPLTGKEIPRAPRPKYQIQLRYPQAEWNSRLHGRVVRLKIRIDPFGKVDETELLATCGSDIIDDAAIVGVKDSEWDPNEIQIDQIGEWLYFEVRVDKPTLTIESPR